MVIHYNQTRLAHQIQGTTSLEPLNLATVERMSKLNFILRSIHMINNKSQVLARGKALQSKNVNLVSTLDFIIVFGIGECQSKHSLFLQVRFMDTSKAADNDSKTAEETGFESSMLAGGTFTIIVIANDNPLDPGITIGSGDLRNTTI